MRIAVPTTNGVLSPHFGRCDEFTMINIDDANKSVQTIETILAPPHQPGMLPQWLADHGANVIIAGGMGQRAIALFTNAGIIVHTGAPELTPQDLVTSFLNESLQTTANTCDNEGHDRAGRCRGGH